MEQMVRPSENGPGYKYPNAPPCYNICTFLLHCYLFWTYTFQVLTCFANR